jgi:hypothetical protein
MKTITTTSIVIILFLAMSLTTFTHHGTNISYDGTKEVTLTGTVTGFQWSNPHVQLYFDVKDEKGKVVSWAAELNSPGVLSREGWRRNQFKPGDLITITVNPSKAGTPVGNTVRSKPILVSGKEVVAARPGRTTVD